MSYRETIDGTPPPNSTHTGMESAFPTNPLEVMVMQNALMIEQLSRIIYLLQNTGEQETEH